MQVGIPKGYNSEKFLFWKVFIPKSLISKSYYSKNIFIPKGVILKFGIMTIQDKNLRIIDFLRKETLSDNPLE